MKVGTPVFLSVLVPLVFFTGCAQKQMVSPEAQLLQGEVNVSDEACWKIYYDLDALYDELKTSERVLGKPLDRSVYDTLNRAKQAVRKKDYDKSRELYRQTIEHVRDHLVDKTTIVAFRRALTNIERRLDGNSQSKEAWADFMDLAVKQQLRRIVIPDFKIEPPETLIDALDLFKQASRDYDDPKIPIEQRGVSFVLKLRDNGTGTHSVIEGEDPFAVPANSYAPVVPKLSVRFITLYDAITLVCDVTGYKFDARCGFVMITPSDDNDGAMKENSGTR